MTVRALHAIRHDGVEYKAGELLQLNQDDENRLVNLGAAVYMNAEELPNQEAPQIFNESNEEVDEDSLTVALGVMTGKEIRVYGERVGVVLPKNASKADMITKIVAHDADIVLDALSDAALLALVKAEGISVADDADREELLEALGE